MKKIHLKESQKIFLKEENEAGTDHPHFEDSDGNVYAADWDGSLGYPFGYWPTDYSEEKEFFVGDAWSTHTNPCGKAAERYFMNCMMDNCEESANNLESSLEDLVYDMEQYGYTYNDETDYYVSADGSDEFDIDGKISEISEGVWNVDYDYMRECVVDAVEKKTYPNSQEIAEHIMEYYANEYDFTTKEGIDAAMELIGLDFYRFFEMGQNEGRIWPGEEIISFYQTEQPDPKTLIEILRELSQFTDVGVGYEEMLDFIMIFEDWRNDGEVTACTVSDYIDGNYGPESYEDDDEGETQYARDGKTQFIPHLANQQQKRAYFQDFRNTRDQAVYAPREKGAGSLARYHAMRYPYGESKEKLGKIIKEEIKKLMERQK